MPGNIKIKIFAALCCLVAVIPCISCRKRDAEYVKKGQAYARQLYRDQYLTRTSHFNTLPLTAHATVFFGDNLIEVCEWNELLVGKNILNRGIIGDTTSGMFRRVRHIADLTPDRLFILGGCNDLMQNIPEQQIIDNYEKFVSAVKFESPLTRIYIQSVPPTSHGELNKKIVSLNMKLRALAESEGAAYVDIHTSLQNFTGSLNCAYSEDGIFLNGAGYAVWKKTLAPYLQ